MTNELDYEWLNNSFVIGTTTEADDMTCTPVQAIDDEEDEWDEC